MTNGPGSLGDPSGHATGTQESPVHDLGSIEPPAPEPIEPDSKDWTWVLRERCPECSFVAADIPASAIGALARELAERWRVALERSEVGIRPRPTTWSVLEYGAHVRDVNQIFAERLRAILQLDYPMFANWDQDAAAIEKRYDRQAPETVAGELVQAAQVFADRFEAIGPDEGERRGRRTDGAEFTAETLGRYYLHDVVHHLHDVRG